MKSKLIVMLTHHDRTVGNALAVFETSKDLPVDYWGFKNVGLPPAEMKKLISALKAAGKKTFLEVVTYSEEECLAGAKLAVEYGFDYLMGTLFYDSVWAYLKNKKLTYLPFVGKVYGSPSVLDGTIESIIDNGKRLVSLGLPGFDLLAYRYTGDAEVLAAKFVKDVKVPVVMAGSVNSPQRIRKVNEIDPWGFTMGSALFEKKFVGEGTFRENLAQVVEVMNSIK